MLVLNLSDEYLKNIMTRTKQTIKAYDWLNIVYIKHTCFATVENKSVEILCTSHVHKKEH